MTPRLGYVDPLRKLRTASGLSEKHSVLLVGPSSPVEENSVPIVVVSADDNDTSEPNPVRPAALELAGPIHQVNQAAYGSFPAPEPRTPTNSPTIASVATQPKRLEPGPRPAPELARTEATRMHNVPRQA